MKENIKKFVDAQNAPGFSGYANAQKELKQGKKLSHWIWYVFPKLKAVGQDSPYERQYGIENLQEAKDYLEEPTLRSRLEEACTILLNHQGKTASSIFGFTDAGNVKSSMTLFYLASNDEIFRQVIDKYFNGVPCQATLYALNMSMPRKEGSALHNDNQNGGSKDTKRTTTRTKGRGAGSIKKGKKPSKARKIKKVAILLVAFVIIVGVFGGIGYGAYSMFAKEKQTSQEEPLAQNTYPESSEESIKIKNLNITLVTSDNVTIDSEGLKKYFIKSSAPLSGNSCVMDTVTNSYKLQYTKDNYNEDIVFHVSIEGCSIGEGTFTYQGLGDVEDDITKSIRLCVSSIDLRIYEELAWYVSVNKRVAEAKYPKYVERIKAVKDEKFAALLTKKLKSIGKDESKPVEEKKDAVKKDDDNIPADIMSRVRHGVIVSQELMTELPLYQRRIIEEYNYFSKKMNRNDKILQDLRHCRTFRDLKYIMRKWADM